MKVISTIREFWSKWAQGRDQEYELDEEWDKILQELRKEVEEGGFNLDENEELYVSILAHVVRDNKEGLDMLAEEVAERARMGEDTTVDESASVTIKTIKPQYSDS